MPEVVTLDFYEPDGTTLIGTLDDSELIECEARPALQELGALRFVVSRHLAAASSALLAKGNLVKYRVPAIDTEPIALFVLKDDISQLISREEQGGEHLEVTGPGGLWLLQHARLNEIPSSTNPALTNPTFRGSFQVEGQWTWHGEPYGAILRRCIEEGQEQPGLPLAAITVDFDRDEDSNGVPWVIIPEDFQVPIGTDVLAMAERLAAAGDLFLVLTPDMVLHAYQTFGRDLTGAFGAATVRFEKAVNTQTELQRKTEFDRVTHLITRDMDQVHRTYVTPDAYDQAVYGFLDIPWTNDEDQVERTALNTLTASALAAEPYTLEISPGLDPANGFYLPGPDGTSGHFWIGDEVTLHTGTGEHDLNAVDCRVTAIALVLDQASDGSTGDRSARSLHIVPELYTGMPEPRFSGVGDSPGAQGVAIVQMKLCPSSPVLGITCDNATSIGSALTLVQPGLEGGYGNWYDGFGQTQRSNVQAHSGTWSFGPTAHRWYHGISVTAGKRYVLKFWLWTPVAGGSITAEYRFGASTTTDPSLHNHNGFSDYAGEIWDSSAEAGDGWVQHCVEWNPPASTAHGRVEVHVTDAYIDDLEIWEGRLADGSDLALVGTSPRASRCDHAHHVFEARNPNDDDDEDHGYPLHTMWTNTVSGAHFLSWDAADGAADWRSFGAAGDNQQITIGVLKPSTRAEATFDVNSTTYVDLSYLSFYVDFSTVEWTHFYIYGFGRANAASQTITFQACHTGTSALSAAGDDVSVGATNATFVSGWKAITAGLTGVQRLSILMKGSNATVDFTYQLLGIMFRKV